MDNIDFDGTGCKSRPQILRDEPGRGGSAAREDLGPVRISAKADYAVRAIIELAAAPDGASLSAREIAAAQEIPQHFLENILGELRRAGIVATHRGPGGGSSLARPAERITVGQVLRAIDGPLAAVRDLPPEQLVYVGTAQHLPALWCQVESCLTEVLDSVTVATLAGRTTPRNADLSDQL
jgi:Rrf2 family protein